MHILPILTERERQILPFVVSGATRDEIAHHFGISEETIKTHLKNIFKKFNVANLRDGFEDIQKYQRNFGIGDWGLRNIPKITSPVLRLIPTGGRIFKHATYKASVCFLKLAISLLNFANTCSPRIFTLKPVRSRSKLIQCAGELFTV